MFADMLQVLAWNIESSTDPSLFLGKSARPGRLIFGKLYGLVYLSHIGPVGRVVWILTVSGD